MLKTALLGCTVGTPIEIWFQDEARVGQKGSLTYVWAPVGSRPAMVRDNRHSSAYLFGAICPAHGVGAAVITPVANTAAMNAHLAEISTQVAPGAQAVLLLDRAGWHQRGKRLCVPANIILIDLPAYSPEPWGSAPSRWKTSGNSFAATNCPPWSGTTTTPSSMPVPARGTSSSVTRNASAPSAPGTGHVSAFNRIGITRPGSLSRKRSGAARLAPDAMLRLTVWRPPRSPPRPAQARSGGPRAPLY